MKSAVSTTEFCFILLIVCILQITLGIKSDSLVEAIGT